MNLIQLQVKLGNKNRGTNYRASVMVVIRDFPDCVTINCSPDGVGER